MSHHDQDRNQQVIDALATAYNMELETVMNYIAISTNLDGVRARHIKDELAADIPTEVEHAQQLAARIKTIGGLVPGSQALRWTQGHLQSPEDTTDIETVIRGVIEAEESAIAQYTKIIDLAGNGFDPATEDLAVTLLADEEEHRREFKGFLKELEKGRLG